MTPSEAPLFVFGTLMDTDVLERVSGARINTLELQPALLSGYRRRLVAGESFPVLVPDADSKVSGLLIKGLCDTALQRVRFFEGDEYSLSAISVELLPNSHSYQLASGVCKAQYFADNAVYSVQNEDWNIVQWQQNEKAQFLVRLDNYMTYFGTLSATEADKHW